MSIKEDTGIVDFLVRAKKATYAGNGVEASSTRPNSHDLHFSEGDLIYIDTYLGSEQFSGVEGLWKNSIPFWAMNYSGRIVGEGFSGGFLKEALSMVSQKQPYRGPLNYENGDYSYRCVVSGHFDWFQGVEEIFKNHVKVYELMFHGGRVK